MEWLTSIRTAIDYMEEHLTDNISAQDVADRVYLSPFFLQKGFSLMTGYGIGEYIRNRRLYRAALDLKGTDDKGIDIALRYGYETPESFSTAMKRRRALRKLFPGSMAQRHHRCAVERQSTHFFP